MSTLAVTNLKHESATGNNIVLASDGTATFAEIISASKGITFPATQSASSDANTLDDYEEGTASVTMEPSSGTVTINTSFNTISYTKIGRLVTCTGDIRVSSVSSPSGAGLNILGLPFTSANLTEGAEKSAVSVMTEISGTRTVRAGKISENSTQFTIYLDAATLNTGTEVIFCLTYVAA